MENMHQKKSRWSSQMAAQVTQLVSLHNYVKIATKIENNHHSESSEIELNGSAKLQS